MMYRAMVVDDEPAALEYICSIIDKKCPNYIVAAQAGNGEEALAMMDDIQPDIVITDVKMPRIDGIGLVSRLHEQYPEVATVIVSGHQDFEYAKGAIQSGVSDYLLKPLKPSDLQEILARLEAKLGRLYHHRRTELMKMMCSYRRPDTGLDVNYYFPSNRYYAAIIRKNGLPKRFSRQTGFEIFSTEDEKIMLYGRDEMEALYLYSEEILDGKPFFETIQALYDAETPCYYVTAVIHENGFPISEFPDVVKKLYRKLDEGVVIGKNQFVSDSYETFHSEASKKEKEQRDLVEYLIREGTSARMISETGKLVDLWNKAGHNQLYIENQLRYLLQLLKKNADFVNIYGSYALLLDDALYYVNSMEELKLEIQALLRLLLPESQPEADDMEQLFSAILSYLHSHMDEPLSISMICAKFNLSQTTLSRWFRKYKGISFSNYLTEIRIGKAKQIIEQYPEAYIKDIAERVGYCDQFYFSRIFRSIVGICPSDYAQKVITTFAKE